MGQQAADHHSSPHAGIWRGINRSRISDITKVKAHLTKAAAEAAGYGDHWQGNHLVDLLAKEAARGYSATEAQVKEYETSVKVEAALLRTTAKLLVAWPVQTPEIKNLTRAPRPPRSKILRGKRHHFVWLQHLGVWRCSDCGISKRRPKCSMDRAPCAGKRWLANGFHATHKLAVAEIVGQPSQLFACIRGGVYAESSARGLLKPCTCTGAGGRVVGKSAGTAYRLKRFFGGLHPKLKGVKLGKPVRFIPEGSDDANGQIDKVSHHVPAEGRPADQLDDAGRDLGDAARGDGKNLGTLQGDAGRGVRAGAPPGIASRNGPITEVSHHVPAEGGPVDAGSCDIAAGRGPGDAVRRALAGAPPGTASEQVPCVRSGPRPKRRRLRGKQIDMTGAFNHVSCCGAVRPECDFVTRDETQGSSAKRQKTLEPKCCDTSGSSSPHCQSVCKPVTGTIGTAKTGDVASADYCCSSVACGAVVVGAIQRLRAVDGVAATCVPTELITQGAARELPGETSVQADYQGEAFALPPEDAILQGELQGIDEADEDVFDFGGDLGLSAYHN